MTKQEALPLRFFLGLFALVTLVIQLVVVPRTGASYASAYPEVAYLEPLYVTAIGLALVGFLVALLAAWQLVAGAVAGRVATRRSTRWANIMAASLIVLAVIFAGVFVHAGFMENVGGPAMLFGLLGSLALVPVAFVLRRWVMKWSVADNVYALSAN
jgi:hypothetical protein